jgi:bifunctional UDP-N-acetylglucosamine pyrophosphorylase/glucosamine-1-phosphate N-acetyltransferase
MKIAIVLAAGQGKRMESDRAKVLHPLAGKPMLIHVVDALARLAFDRTLVIVGHQAEQVRSALTGRNVECVLQDCPRGTAHAVLQSREALARETGPVLILNGDTPLLRDETLASLWEHHRKTEATLTLLSATVADPTGYGRLIRTERGTLGAVVEERDATSDQRAISEINTGVYVVNAPFLFEALSKIRPDNRQQEYYLTDLIRIAVSQNVPLSELPVDSEEIVGINSRRDLAEAERIFRMRINTHWMARGVTFMDPNATYIDASVTLARDVRLYPNVVLEGETSVAEGTVLHPCRIRNSRVGQHVRILDYCVIEEAEIESGVSVGPFAHLRPGTRLCAGAKVGNFVEVKKSELGEGSKVNHLAYLGDAIVGKGVNIGAGVITCNFDGKQKHPTLIEDNVFIGSDVQLIAPVRIGAGAIVAAGTTVVRDVPPDALAISRVPQDNKPGWVAQRRRKKG